MVACTSVSGHSSMLWPCTSGELVAEASAGRAGFVGVLPVVLNGERYGLLPGKVKQNHCCRHGMRDGDLNQGAGLKHKSNRLVLSGLFERGRS